MSSQAGDVTRLLGEVRAGNADAESSLAVLVYDELHGIARRLMWGERASHTLQATALVHEAYLRLLGEGDAGWDDRVHFFRVAATAMRRILIDHARAHASAKRGGAVKHVDFEEPMALGRDNFDELLAVDEALDRLAAVDPRQARIVELRFFVGLSEDEIGGLLQLSTRTIKREWRSARAWLHAELAASGDSSRDHDIGSV